MSPRARPPPKPQLDYVFSIQYLFIHNELVPLDTPAQVLQLLLTEAHGLAEPEIRRRLQPPVSQPTLWRVLNALRSEGRIRVDGRARATRYHAAEHVDVNTLRRRRLHRHIAERLVRDMSLRDRVQQRLELLRQVNPHAAVQHDRWAGLLAGPLPALLRVLTEASESSDDLRRESPFTVLADDAERMHIFRSVPAN